MNSRQLCNDLKSRPKPEELELAKRALDVRERQAWFSGEKLNRLEKLYKEKTISLGGTGRPAKTGEVDIEQVKEYRAKLDWSRRERRTRK